MIKVLSPNGEINGVKGYDASSRTLTFVPSLSLSPNTVYRVEIESSELKNSDQYDIYGGVVSQFRTAPPEPIRLVVRQEGTETLKVNVKLRQ